MPNPQNTPLSSPSTPPGSPDEEREKLASLNPELGDDYIPYVLSDKRLPWLTDRKTLKAQKDLRADSTDLTDKKIKQAQESLKQANKGLNIDAEKAFYNGNSKRGMGVLNKIAGLISKNPKTSGGVGLIVSLLITAGLGFATIMGPLQLLQFSNLLSNINFGPSESQTDIRLRKLFAYSSFAKNVNGFENTRLGTIEAFRANKIDAKLAKSGMISTFTPDGKFTGFDIDVDKLPADVAKDINSLTPQNDPDGSKRAKALSKHFKGAVTFKNGKPHITPKGTLESRKLFSQAMKISPDFHGNASALSKRVLIKRANVSFNPITRLENKVLGNFAKKYTDFQEKRSERLKGNDVDFPNATPNQTEPENPESQRSSQEADTYNKVQKEGADIVNNLKLPGGLATGAAASGVGAIVAAVCVVRDLADGVADMQLTQRLVLASNLGVEALSWPSKMLTGDFGIEEMFMYVSNFYSKENGSAYSASTIQNEITQKENRVNADRRTLDQEEYQHLNPDLDSNWAKIDETFKSLGAANTAIGAVCNVMDAPGQFLSSVANFLSRGASEKLSGATVGRLMSNLLGVMAGSIDTTKITGAPWGELVNVGLMHLVNVANSAHGTPIASDQTTENARAFYEDYKYLNDERSTIAKLLDVTNVDSVASQALIKTYHQPVIETVASLPKTTLLSFGDLNKSAKASGNAPSREDNYGIPNIIPDPIFTNPPEGTVFVTTTGEKVDFDNPYILITQAQQRLKDNPGAKEYIEKCNQITISEDFYATTKNADEGAAINYMKKDGGCEDPIKETNTTPVATNNPAAPQSFEPKPVGETEFNKVINGPNNYPDRLISGRCTLDNSVDPSLKPYTWRFMNDCNDVYGKIENLLGQGKCQHLIIKIGDEGRNTVNTEGKPIAPDAPAFVGGGIPGGDCTIYFAKWWISEKKPNDIDPGVIPHEATHLFQNYDGSEVPTWITEGMATYMSYKLGYSRGTLQCPNGKDLQPIDNGGDPYGCGAVLLKYIERVYSNNFVVEINADIKNTIKANKKWENEGGKDDAFIKSKTGGKSVEQLFEECRQPGNECASVGYNTSIDKYLISNIPKYQPIAQKPSLTKTIAGIFNPSVIAEEPAQPQTITLTPEQATVAQTCIGLAYVKEGMAHAALEEGDDEAMKAMYDGNLPSGSSGGGRASAGLPQGDRASLVERINKAQREGKISFNQPELHANDLKNDETQGGITINTLAALVAIVEESGVAEESGAPIPVTSVRSGRPFDQGEHPKGKAFDIGYHGNDENGRKLAQYLIKNSDALKLHMIIWENDFNINCMWMGKGDSTTCTTTYAESISGHRDHLHISFDRPE